MDTQIKSRERVSAHGEVFTAPREVNAMLDLVKPETERLDSRFLDLLPQDLFKSPDTKFLDPFSKSGVFLREIVKRLDRGLESLMPDRQLRIEHILHN